MIDPDAPLPSITESSMTVEVGTPEEMLVRLMPNLDRWEYAAAPRRLRMDERWAEVFADLEHVARERRRNADAERWWRVASGREAPG